MTPCVVDSPSRYYPAAPRFTRAAGSAGHPCGVQVQSCSHVPSGENGAAAMELDITREQTAESCVIAVSGEVDVYTSPRLKREIADAVDAGCVEVVVDLDSIGCHRQLRPWGACERVRGSRSRVAPCGCVHRESILKSSGSLVWTRSSAVRSVKSQGFLRIPHATHPCAAPFRARRPGRKVR